VNTQKHVKMNTENKTAEMNDQRYAQVYINAKKNLVR
jgi:hypothetical protein